MGDLVECRAGTEEGGAPENAGDADGSSYRRGRIGCSVSGIGSFCDDEPPLSDPPSQGAVVFWIVYVVLAVVFEFWAWR